MKKILSGLVILLSTVVFVPPVLADFIGPYAVSNWTTTLTGTPPGGLSTINTSGAPSSIQILGGNSGCSFVLAPCTINFTIAAVASGIVSFHWDYQTFDVDGPAFESFGFLLNGIFTELSDAGGLNTQSDNEAFPVSLGNIFGFRLDCTDCQLGPANITISNFSAPVGATVPEPSTLLLVGTGLFGLLLARRQKAKCN